MLTNKFTSLGDSFTSTLGDARAIQQRQRERGGNAVSLEAAAGER